MINNKTMYVNIWLNITKSIDREHFEYQSLATDNLVEALNAVEDGYTGWNYFGTIEIKPGGSVSLIKIKTGNTSGVENALPL